MKTTIRGVLKCSRPFKSHRGKNQLLALMKDALLPPRYYAPRYYVVVPATETTRRQIVDIVGRKLNESLAIMVDSEVAVSGDLTPWGNGIGGDMRRAKVEATS
jgi:hypothetical protein